MGAAAGRVARACEPEAERREALVVEVDDQLGERRRLVAQPLDARLGDEPRALLDRPRAPGSAGCRRGSRGRPAPGRTAAPSGTGRAGRTSPGSGSGALPGAPRARTGTPGRPGRRSGTCRCSRRRARRHALSSSIGTAPAECERSQSTGAGRRRVDRLDVRERAGAVGHVGERRRARRRRPRTRARRPRAAGRRAGRPRRGAARGRAGGRGRRARSGRWGSSRRR